MSQYGAVGLRYSAATRKQRAATRLAIRPGTHSTRGSVRARHGLSHYTIFCIVTGGEGSSAATRRASERVCAATLPRHYRARPATRRPSSAVRAAWAQCARRLGLGVHTIQSTRFRLSALF